jgi:hypothetical protein
MLSADFGRPHEAALITTHAANDVSVAVSIDRHVAAIIEWRTLKNTGRWKDGLKET